MTREPRDRDEADGMRAALEERLHAAFQDPEPDDPAPDDTALEAARARCRERSIPYPFGSGQGDEIAFRAGLKPMFRELLPVASLPAARERLEKAGFSLAIAARVYGDTRDGWDDTSASLDAAHPEARQAMFVGRDPGLLAEAVALDLEKTAAADLALGRLLGYPKCCVEAFVSTSEHRRAPELHRGALGRTEGAPAPRLNTLDLAVFHYVPWYPCNLRCALSLAYADRLASVVAARAPDFVKAIDEALAMHRLLLTDELQVSIRGAWTRGTLTLDEIVPTARHRHPRATLSPTDEALLARICARLSRADVLRVEGSALVLDGARVELPLSPLLVPFGVRAG